MKMTTTKNMWYILNRVTFRNVNNKAVWNVWLRYVRTALTVCGDILESALGASDCMETGFLITRLNALNPGVADIDGVHGVTVSAIDWGDAWYVMGVIHKLAPRPDAFDVSTGQLGVSSKSICTEPRLSGVCGLSVQLLYDGPDQHKQHQKSLPM